MPYPVYILKRFLSALPTILVVTVIGFVLMRWNFTVGPIDIPLPNGHSIHLLDQITRNVDPLAELSQNPQISPAALQKEKERLGLDKPLYVQYWLWISHVLQFDPGALLKGQFDQFFTPDLGKSFNGENVTTLLMSRAGNTILLNIVVMLLTWMIALPLGIYAALHWRSVADRLLTVFSTVGMAVPSFVLALILAVWAVKTELLPLGGLVSSDFESLNPLSKVIDVARHLALPVIVLTIGGIAGLSRQMRANLLDVLGAEYVRTARAKGLPENKVIYKHAVRTAINPLVTLMGYEFSALLSGSVLVETVLNFPGLGYTIYKAVIETDTNVVMASLVLSTIMLVMGNLLADILLTLVDPRIELQS